MAKRDYSSLIPPEITDIEMSNYWMGKYNFCRTKLKLSQKKAEEWATRAVRAKLETIALSLR
jgi:hypothetical protein